MKILATALLVLCLTPNLWADTLGEPTIGLYEGDIENIILAGRFTAPSNGTLDSIYGHMRISPARTAKLGVYNWDTKAMIDSSVTAKGNDSGWIGYDLTIGANISSGTTYALAAWGDLGGGDAKLYIDIAGGSHGLEGRTYGPWPDTWVPTDSGGYLFSIYVTYTPEEEAAAGQMIIIQ